jgi:hypothetical protein
MKKVSFKNRVFLGALAIALLSMTVVSCVRFFRVDCPEVVETNSTFEVRLVIDDGLEGGHQHYNSWGYLAVQLPVGWTINADELEYEFFPLQNRTDGDGHKDIDYYVGKFEDDPKYVEMCVQDTYTEPDCYWLGFSTLQKVSECMDSIVVKVKIHTDNQVGEEKFLQIVFQENGDAWGELPKEEILDVKPEYPYNRNLDGYVTGPKPIAREEGGDNGNNASFYAYVKAIQNPNGIEGVSVADKDGSFQLLSPERGQLQVNLSDSRKIGATAMVYDMKGQMVATQTLTRTDNVISTSLPKGVYAVAVQKDGVRSIKKTVVK